MRLPTLSFIAHPLYIHRVKLLKSGAIKPPLIFFIETACHIVGARAICILYLGNALSGRTSRAHRHRKINSTTMPGSVHVERTLALIKPDAVRHFDEIEGVILQAGLCILQKRQLQLSPEQCSDFYAEKYGKMFFPSLTAFMSSGPIIALVLARDEAITVWKKLMGPVNSTKAKETHPNCLRARYGTSDLRNAVHGSECSDAAEREIKFMFPDSVIEPIPLGVAGKDYLDIHVNAALLTGLTELCKRKPTDPYTWLADWLLNNNPNKPKIAMVEPPSDI
ncbi:nucleoside diphosphate kinase homolog 5-like [Engraulis encrasicolus]|uniref:nucleoside diphosphate kinase homolog 5-like n=1 Tax=Engraulis encrasicolus TaxID=184585 RepID=UPI002FD2C319